jgi:hypothetical protein
MQLSARKGRPLLPPLTDAPRHPMSNAEIKLLLRSGIISGIAMTRAYVQDLREHEPFPLADKDVLLQLTAWCDEKMRELNAAQAASCQQNT